MEEGEALNEVDEEDFVLVGGNGANEDVDGDVEDARAVDNDKANRQI